MELNPDPKPIAAPRLVIVIWEDTAGLDDTWNDRQEAEELKPGTMSSVGWIIKDEPHYLTLTSSAEFDADLVGDVNCIPIGCIQKIIDLPYDTLDLFPEGD